MMDPGEADPEYQTMAALSEVIRHGYVNDEPDPWARSPFSWILSCPSRQKGAIGEKLVADWCATKGLDVGRSPDSEADRIIEGHRVEIKLSTLWKSGGFKFQQVRDQNYEYLFCLGISPFSVQAWVVPKPALHTYVIGVTGQHTGAEGTDTAWIGFQADNPPRWIRAYGGSLGVAYAQLEAAGRGSH